MVSKQFCLLNVKSSLKLVIELLPNTFAEEEHLLYLMKLDKTRRDAALVIETQKKYVKPNMTNMSSHMFFLKVI